MATTARESAPPPSGEVYVGAATHLRDVGARSARGLLREYNADHFVVAEVDRSVTVFAANLRLPEPIIRAQGALLAVASGVGRRSSGSFASSAKLGALLDYTADYLPWHLGESNRELLLERFAAALARSERAQRQICLSRQGTPLPTSAGIVFANGDGLFSARSGDTRCYLLHGPAMERLDVPADLVITESGEDPAVEARYRSVREGDRLLLCTKGVWRWVPDPAIEQILRDAHQARGASDALLVEARRAGGRDDATAVVAFV
jgi:protein phosphatase